MSEKHIDGAPQRYADERFSTTLLRQTIEERFAQPEDSTFSFTELMELRDYAQLTLDVEVEGEPLDVYGAEVMVPLEETDVVYSAGEGGKWWPVAYGDEGESATLYGFIHQFTVNKLPDREECALIAQIEECVDGLGQTRTWHVPVVIEGANSGVRLYDAPVPVGQRDGTVRLDRAYEYDPALRVQEDDEQVVIQSLIELTKAEFFEKEQGERSTRALWSYAVELVEAGYIADADDFVTACNYYLLEQAHDYNAWLLEVDGEMDIFDGAESEASKRELVTGTLELVAIDMEECENADRGLTVYCRRQTGDDTRVYRGRFAEVESWQFVHSDEGDDDDGDLPNEDEIPR